MPEYMNGAPVVAGLAAEREPVAPIIGSTRARIAYPLRVPPTITGQWARAWSCDLANARRKIPAAIGQAPDAMVAHWLLEAPWSSQIVHSYSLVLVHLRFNFKQPVVHYLEGATHEIALWAIHPQADRAHMLDTFIERDNWLQPVVFASQLVAASDNAAEIRAYHAIDLVCSGRLSPHPTHVRAWVELFGDNMLRRAVAPVQTKVED